LGFGNAFGENGVKFFRESQLVELQLGKTADHHCVFEVGRDQLL